MYITHFDSELHSHCRGQGFDSPMLYTTEALKQKRFKAFLCHTENDVDNGHIFGHMPNEKPADKAGMQISCLLHALPLAASISSYRFRTTYLNDCSIYGEVPPQI